MDLVSSCKVKLGLFRVKELKDVLTQLGLAKQGKKLDLVDRILAVLSDDQVSNMQGWSKKNSIGKEDVAKIIDDTYRKMQSPGATELASKGQSCSDVSNAKLKEEVDNSSQLDMIIRCPCGSSLVTEIMIQCEDLKCRTWQHSGCVIIPEKSSEGVPPVPSQFYCEICRINRVDPFWHTLAHPLSPVKLTAANIPTDGTNPIQSVEKTFQLTRADRELIQRAEFDIQAWCVLLNDKVLFRMQWPQYSDLQVNGIPVRTINRPGSQMLGANGRDDGPAITTCTREGINKITLTGCDARTFCLGVRLARRRTVQQVLKMIPSELDGEHFEDALARVCRCIRGGNTTEDADSDSDLEVVADFVTVNLRCPMSGSRIKTAGRFRPCIHMGCFDLDTFVQLNQRSRKWQCPLCLINCSLETVIIDPYFNRITTKMRDCGDDITDIEVKADGSWRVKNEDEGWDLAQWHFPDGSLCVVTDKDVKPDLETSKQVKPEEGSEGHNGLKLGIRKNRNGIWEVSKPEEMHTLSSEEQVENKYNINCQNVRLMRSSATGSCRDGEDPSVNQDGGGHFDLSANNVNELDSVSLNFDSAYRIPSAPLGNPDIIVLSDSEDENLLSHGHAPEAGLVGNGDVFGIPLWPSMASSGQAGPGLQLFGTEGDVSESLIDVEHSSVSGLTSMDSYSFAPDVILETALQVPESLNLNHSNTNSGLIENPMTFCEEDSSLQFFLPTCPNVSSGPAEMRDQSVTQSSTRAEDWISLSVGGGGSSSHGQPAVANGLGTRHQTASREEGRLESLADTASMLLIPNEDRSERATPNRQTACNSPFSFPRQPRSVPPRSVRPRLYLSIDSDSD